MKIIKLILSMYLLMSVNTLLEAQFGSVDKSFSDFGVKDSTSLKNLKIADLILKEPYLFDSEKINLFEQMKSLPPNEINSLPVLVLMFRLSPYMGINFAQSDNQNSPCITRVYENGIASKIDLRVGDCLISINDCGIRKNEDVKDCLNQIKSGSTFKILIARDENELEFEVKAQNRIGTYQPWKDEYYLDLVFGNIRLDDFTGSSSSINVEDALLTYRTPEGKNYKDLNIPRSTLLLDTSLSREILEDRYLAARQKKFLFKELRDLPEERYYLFKVMRGLDNIPTARRMLIESQMLAMKFEPKLGVRLEFDYGKNLSKVVAIENESCLKDAGVKVGDYLRSLDGINRFDDIFLLGGLQRYKAGQIVRVEIERDNELKIYDVKLKNHFGDYRNWSSELLHAITDKNYELEDYGYFKHKKYIRNTTLWGIPLKQITVSTSFDMEMGYLPTFSCTLSILFYDESNKKAFQNAANNNSLSVVYLTRKDKLVYGGPEDPLYILMPVISFEEDSNMASVKHAFELGKLFRNVSNQEYTNHLESSHYLKSGFQIFDVQLKENNQPVNLQKMMKAYNEYEDDKYRFKDEEIKGRNKKN